MAPIEPYTLALTSCGRFDLLERTLGSLLPRLEGPLSKIIIIEDSGNSDVIDVVYPFAQKLKETGYLSSGKYLGNGIDVIVNNPPLGQILSIDRLYSQIETEWVFHCEDDWAFHGEEFIQKSFVLLKNFAQYSMVILRDVNEFSRSLFLPQEFQTASVRYRVIDDSKQRNRYKGISFNPGLRRMSDYRIVGSYADIGVTTCESRVSDLYYELGYTYVFLSKPAMYHIGQSSHVPKQERPRTFKAKSRHSIRKRMERAYQRIDPNHDPLFRARRRFKHSRAEVISVTK